MVTGGEAGQREPGMALRPPVRPARSRPVPAAREAAVEAVARLFHETYERLAPQFGYRTRELSAVPWDQVPAENRALMVATVREVLPQLAALSAAPGQEQGR